MRIWDINPGYLNRQSLLGEHLELHGMAVLLRDKKKGYAKHPETLRWIGYGWALRQRHQLLAVEMALRGFIDQSPVMTRTNKGVWPERYIDEPYHQFQILKAKYKNKAQGRIPLPENAQQLWRQHKFSILARDENLYRKLGRAVSSMKPHDDFSELTKLVTELIRRPPSIGGLQNSLQHMWGYVSDCLSTRKDEVESWTMTRLLAEIQHRSLTSKEPYLTSSTALSEFKVWIPNT